MARRITRAKDKIREARIPFRMPTADDLPTRVDGVLAVLFLVFNEGYLATGPDTDPVRAELTGEAIRLTRLVRELLPDDGEAAGLLAFPLGPTAVRDLADRLIGWLEAPEDVRERTREALVATARARWSWEGVAEGVIAAAEGRLDALAPPA
jgi:RNA polymerase sigma-70 factor (ECF subfamily)